MDLSVCEHISSTVCRRRHSNASIHIVRQCTTCGCQVGGAIQQQRLSRPLEEVPWWDESLREAWQAHRDGYYEQLAEANRLRKSEWWQEYSAYLESSEWAEKRRLVLLRDNYQCQACLSCEAVQAHHKTYENLRLLGFGNEPLFDIVAICLSCHSALHNGRVNEAS